MEGLGGQRHDNTSVISMKQSFVVKQGLDLVRDRCVLVRLVIVKLNSATRVFPKIMVPPNHPICS